MKTLGYSVVSAGHDEEALEMVASEQFVLVLIGRRSLQKPKDLDQRLRGELPDLLN